jgi:DNA-binding response OmpR family regulator
MNTTPLRTVLYVDDEPDIRTIVQIALSISNELTVYTSESGTHALELARQLKPDVLLLDVMMPGLDGPGTLEKMRADPETAHIPIIFVTAKAMPREIALFREMGAVGVIPKPFDPMELINQLRTLWETNAAESALPEHLPKKATVQLQITQLAGRFLQRSRDEAALLHTLAEHAGDGDPIVLEQMERLAHKIYGSGSMFGYAAVSACAGDLESLVELLRARDGSAGVAIEPAELLNLLECTGRLASAVDAADVI